MNIIEYLNSLLLLDSDIEIAELINNLIKNHEDITYTAETYHYYAGLKYKGETLISFEFPRYVVSQGPLNDDYIYMKQLHHLILRYVTQNLYNI